MAIDTRTPLDVPSALSHRASPSASRAWGAVAASIPAALGALHLSTVDLAYQVRAGDLMLRSHAVLRVDPFSFTAGGRPWLDQQWGAQVVFALVARVGGWTALALMGAGLIGLTFALVDAACRNRGASAPLAAALTLGGFVVSFRGLAVRPQLIGMALFALTLWLLSDRRRPPRRLWWLPAVGLAWANAHGSFFMGPLLIGLAWIEDRGADKAARRLLERTGVLFVGATLVNPFGLRAWSYVWSLSTNPQVRRFVSEWQPPTIHHPAGFVFFGSVVVVAVALVVRRRSMAIARLVPLLTLGLFLAVGLQSVRGAFWWALAAPSALATLFGGSREGARQDIAEPSPVPLIVTAMFLAIAVLIPTVTWIGAGSLPRPPARLVSDAPIALTAAVDRTLGSEGRMFNAQRWGSWFELAIPHRRVFVDSRVEVYPASVWTEYVEVSDGRRGWQATLARWGVTVVVVDRREQAALIPLIDRDPGWRRVYADSAGLVFARTAPATGT
jgi:hypothetical protein